MGKRVPILLAMDTQDTVTSLKAGISSADLLRTIVFAADKHSRQRRKDADASPYINHPIAVAAVLAVEGDVTDGPTLVAAILHDTVEDTETTFEELSGQFGEDVSNLVHEVTDDKSLDKAVRKQLQIEHAAKSSAKAKQIKLADKICNIREIMSGPPADWSLQRRYEYLDWAQKVVCGCRGVNEKLEQVFDNAMKQACASMTIVASRKEEGEEVTSEEYEEHQFDYFVAASCKGDEDNAMSALRCICVTPPDGSLADQQQLYVRSVLGRIRSTISPLNDSGKANREFYLTHRNAFLPESGSFNVFMIEYCSFSSALTAAQFGFSHIAEQSAFFLVVDTFGLGQVVPPRCCRWLLTLEEQVSAAEKLLLERLADTKEPECCVQWGTVVSGNSHADAFANAICDFTSNREKHVFKVTFSTGESTNVRAAKLRLPNGEE